MMSELHSLWESPQGLADEPGAPASVRAQTAIVRSLADALEQLPPSSDAAIDIREQLQEELVRLGSRIEEAALHVARR
jgi:hypothetical protein